MKAVFILLCTFCFFSVKACEKCDLMYEYLQHEIESSEKHMKECHETNWMYWYLDGKLECLYETQMLYCGSFEKIKCLPLKQQLVILSKNDSYNQAD